MRSRQIFFEMGFTEMPTNQFVESGFWVCAYTPFRRFGLVLTLRGE